MQQAHVTLPLLLLTLALAALPATAQVPGLLSHQGKVTVSGTNYTGAGSFKFALVNAAGDTTYWSNDGTSAGGSQPTAAVSLAVARGVFSVNLGDTAVANMTQVIPPSAFSTDTVYLRVWFNDGVNGSQLLTPDRQITSVAYALKAASATETEPLFTNSVAAAITSGQTNNWTTAYGWGNHASAGYLTSYTETDPLFAASAAYGITGAAIANWNTAYGWGNHAMVGYLKSYTETDPIFSASAASGIAAGDIATWNAKVGGSGTAHYVPAFTASGTVGNSAIVSAANGNVGIGTTTPAYNLDVAGSINGTAITLNGAPVVTNNASGVTLSGTFTGNGAGLTNIPAATFVAPPPGMVLIPAGAFTMGDSLDGESDATPISVTVSALYMDVNLTSWSQWQSVYYWATDHGYGFVHAGAGKAANHPVQTVDWYDCVKWSNARSQQAGLTPVYYTDAGLTQVYTNGETDAVYANWTAKGYRLPTEAEWEKAARGGLNGQRFPWGNVITENLANYYGMTGSYSYDLGPNGYNSIGSIGGTSPATSPVGSFAANGYGLYDMAGNVFEWCWDWYGTPYAGGSDPHGPAGPMSKRVQRGGNWGTTAIESRCAFRNNYDPNSANNSWLGFRCVRGL